jgi:long-chain acyl-CoA synthetase
VTVPIYASNTTEECLFILQDSGSKAIFVDGDVGEKGAKGRLTRILEAREKLPDLALVIAFDGKEASAEKKVVGLGDLEKEGEAYGKEHPKELAERTAAVTPEMAACFIYTSGTTGSPKGVVLPHRAWVYEAQAVAEVGLMKPDEVVLLFLPMAHSFGKVIAAVWLGLGFTLAFCENPDKLMEYLPEIKPTVLPAVPRIFEKVYGGVIQKALAAPGMKGKLAAWAMKEFDAYAAARSKGE